MVLESYVHAKIRKRQIGRGRETHTKRERERETEGRDKHTKTYSERGRERKNLDIVLTTVSCSSMFTVQ